MKALQPFLVKLPLNPKKEEANNKNDSGNLCGKAALELTCSSLNLIKYNELNGSTFPLYLKLLSPSMALESQTQLFLTSKMPQLTLFESMKLLLN